MIHGLSLACGYIPEAVDNDESIGHMGRWILTIKASFVGLSIFCSVLPIPLREKEGWIWVYVQ